MLFVPCTPGGRLQKLIQEEEDKFTSGTKLKRIRIVERGGTKLLDILCTNNPWEGEDSSMQEQRRQERNFLPKGKYHL